MKHPSPISALSHREFDEHWLRAYSYVMPWYRASQQWQTPYTEQQFAQHVRDRIVEVVGQKEFPEQILRPAAPFLQHVVHMTMRDAVYTHLDRLQPYQLKEVIRHDLKRIKEQGIYVIPDEHHPLHGHKDARESTTKYGETIQTLNANERDKKFAQKFGNDGMLNTIFNAAVPEIVNLDPAARISEYAPQLRKKIRSALEGKGTITEQQRSEFIRETENEWVRMSSTDATIRCAKVLAEHGMPDLLDESTADVIAKLATLPMDMNMEPVRRSALELLALRCAQGDDVDDLERVVRGMKAYLKENNLNFCDRPSCGVASLALFLRFTGTQKILSRI